LHGHNHIVLLTKKDIDYTKPSSVKKGRLMKKSTTFSSLITKKNKCKFTVICSLYSNASYTCTHTGGNYCGKYRKFDRLKHKLEPAEKNGALEIPQ